MSAVKGTKGGRRRAGKLSAIELARRSRQLSEQKRRAHAEAAQRGELSASPSANATGQGVGGTGGHGDDRRVLDEILEALIDIKAEVGANTAFRQGAKGAGKGTASKGDVFPKKGGGRELGVDDEGLLAPAETVDQKPMSNLDVGYRNPLESGEFQKQFRILSDSVQRARKHDRFLAKDDMYAYERAGQELYLAAQEKGDTKAMRNVQKQDAYALYLARRFQEDGGVTAVPGFEFGVVLHGLGTWAEVLELCEGGGNKRLSSVEAALSEAGFSAGGSLVTKLSTRTLVRATRLMETLALAGGPGIRSTVSYGMGQVRLLLLNAHTADALDVASDLLRELFEHRNAHLSAWFTGQVSSSVLVPTQAASFRNADADEAVYGNESLWAAAKVFAKAHGVATGVSVATAALRMEVAELRELVQAQGSSGGGGSGGDPSGGGDSAGGNGKGKGKGAKRLTRKKAKEHVKKVTPELNRLFGKDGSMARPVPKEVLDAGFAGGAHKVCKVFAAKQAGLCNMSLECQKAYCEGIEAQSGGGDGEGNEEVKWEACKAGFHKILKPKSKSN